jgi:hypothetical protein
VKSFADDEIDADPGEEQSPSQLPLDTTEAELEAVVLLKNTVPKEIIEELQINLFF